MKYAFWGFGLIMGGIIGVVFIVMFQSVTINNETEYYVLKEAMEASMLESVDLTCYRYQNEDNSCGEVVKISEQKFVENFTRRFTETSTFGQGNYNIIYNQISETPPKVSLMIVDSTNKYNIYNTFSVDLDATQINIVNQLSAILDVYK